MLRQIKTLLTIFFVNILIAGSFGCTQKQETKEVSLEKRKVLEAQESFDSNNSLRIAVGSMITPKEGYAYYKQLLDYIGEKVGRSVKFIDKGTYSEINDMLKSGDIEVAFVCGGPYVDGHNDFGLELLVAPQVNGETLYYSYIIVHASSTINNFEKLKGKTFAFADPDSNTGKLVPCSMLAEMNETPDSFFKTYIFYLCT